MQWKGQGQRVRFRIESLWHLGSAILLKGFTDLRILLLCVKKLILNFCPSYPNAGVGDTDWLRSQ